MISIIIASINPSYLSAIRENISQTVGIPYELLAYNNAETQSGICEIYNQGTQEAKYEILCFMHEDLSYKTAGWGDRVLSVFNNSPSAGLLGVAGSSYKALCPGGWWNDNIENQDILYYNFIQDFKHTERDSVQMQSNPKASLLAKVACIDGFWFCTRKSIAQKMLFDENLLKRFHGYDIDYSLSVQQLNYDVIVTFDILIEHFSEGRFNKEWLEETIKLHKKWSAVLPLDLEGLGRKNILQYEEKTFKNFFKKYSGEIDYLTMLGILKSAYQSEIVTVSFFIRLQLILFKIYSKRFLSRTN